MPTPSNPQSFNRFSYVNNNPLRYIDPTGHRPDDGCRDYGCNFGTNAPTSSYSTTKKKKPSSDTGGTGLRISNVPATRTNSDDQITLTLARNEAVAIENTADNLKEHYNQTGDRWENGVGLVTGLGMLVIDVPTCFVGGVFTGGATCAGAVFLTGVVVPGATYLGGQLGGHAQAEAYDKIGEYLEDALIQNSAEQLTITISEETRTTVILPGGVGPSTTIYTINVEGYTESVFVANSPGKKAIDSLFGD